MGYRRHRLDQNHKIIENALWKTGWAVLNLSQSQVDGCPDLFIAKGGRVVAVEIKSPTGRLNGFQEAFQKVWPAECVTLRTVEDVLALSASAAPAHFPPRGETVPTSKAADGQTSSPPDVLPAKLHPSPRTTLGLAGRPR